VTDETPPARSRDEMPRWVLRAIVLFWVGSILALVLRWGFSQLHSILLLLLVSLFLSLAIEPGVNRLASRGWKRGSATGLILLGVFAGAITFIVSIGTLMFQQVADVLKNSDTYVNRVVNFLNDNFNTKIDAQEWKDKLKDPDGPVQHFIRSHSSDAVRLSVNALGFLLQAFSVLLVTFYLVADGPKMRRGLCSRLRPDRQRKVLRVWDLAINKTGSYLYSRALIAGLSAFFHWVAFQIIGVPAPVALALWVGIISQFIPVVGTYIAGFVPILFTLVNKDSLVPAIAVAAFVLLYQQVENYVFLPRITAKTMELHPAVAFMSALAGAALLGPVGAILGLPAAAMASAVVSEWGGRDDVVEHPLTTLVDRDLAKQARKRRRRRSHPVAGGTDAAGGPPDADETGGGDG
jgi:predicted PurR-regulated permease PerM